MALHYSDHAQKQMHKRGITKKDVEQALRLRIGNPGPGEPGTIWVQGRAAGGRTLRVCVRTADQEFVITAAWPDE